MSCGIGGCSSCGGNNPFGAQQGAGLGGSRIRRDMARLQQDQATGNVSRLGFDKAKLFSDESRLLSGGINNRGFSPTQFIG